MFETLEEVPEAIKQFYYEEIVSEATGETTEESFTYEDAESTSQEGIRLVAEYHDVTYLMVNTRGQQVSWDKVKSLLDKGKSVDKFIPLAVTTEEWTFYDDYIDWLKECSEVDEYNITPQLDEEGNAIEFEPKSYSDVPIFTSEEETFRATHLAPAIVKNEKLEGILFEGVMCSATKEDMWGLSSVQSYLIGGGSTPFKFDNGNVLLLTPDNYADFMTVWVPFRLSFFEE